MGHKKGQEQVIKTLYGVPILRSHDRPRPSNTHNTFWTTKNNQGGEQGYDAFISGTAF